MYFNFDVDPVEIESNVGIRNLKVASSSFQTMYMIAVCARNNEHDQDFCKTKM